MEVNGFWSEIESPAAPAAAAPGPVPNQPRICSGKIRTKLEHRRGRCYMWITGKGLRLPSGKGVRSV